MSVVKIDFITYPIEKKITTLMILKKPKKNFEKSHFFLN
jgi:hypothetical protein